MRLQQLCSISTLLLVAAGCTEQRQETPKKPEPPPQVRILAGGDVMLSRHVYRIATAQNDPAWPFRKIAPAMSGADIAFVNLEAPFSDRGKQPPLSTMIFKTAPEMIAGLELAGIDVVSTANNHSRDCGPYGVSYTYDLLTQHGIAVAGSGLDKATAHSGTVLERKGTRFGFLAFTYDQLNGNYKTDDDRIAGFDVAQMQLDVKALKQRADVVIVSMHAGVEYAPTPHPMQIDFAHAAIDAGAAVVLGHHPHVRQPVEQYHDGVIFYSLGNFIFDQFHRPETEKSYLAEIVFTSGKRHSFRTIDLQLEASVPHVVTK